MTADEIVDRVFDKLVMNCVDTWKRGGAAAARKAIEDAIQETAFTMANGLTRAETEATPSCAGLTVKTWTVWRGGACPVDRNAIVEIRFEGDPLGEIDRANTFRWTWDDNGTRGDIIAYRVL